MTRSLSRGQSLLMCLVVLLTLGAGIWGLVRIGEKQGLFRNTFALLLDVSDAHEAAAGTSVRIRGVEVGTVARVEFVDELDTDGKVRLHLEIDEKFRERLFNDATAQIQSRGLLGTSVVSIAPGKPSAGALVGDTIRVVEQPDLAKVTAKLYAVADRTEELLKEIQESNGTLVKLLRDDDLYGDFRQITTQAKSVLVNANESIGVVKAEVGTVKEFVRNGQEAVQSIRQNAEAMKGLPILRNYVEDAPSILVRPNCSSERSVYSDIDLFEPGKAVLTSKGREHLQAVANWLNGNRVSNSEVVVVSFADPRDQNLTHAGAKKLTEKQAEVVTEFLRDKGVHKLSFWTRRKVAPLGMGKDSSPVVEKEALPAAHVQILLFVPHS